MAERWIVEAARVWVEASCASQGLPVRVSDAPLVAQVAGLLGVPARPLAGGAPSDPAAASGAPDRREAAGVELVVPRPGGRCDDQVVEDGSDDRVLAGQGQGLPALA